MRVHRDGYIQASKLELCASEDLIRRAQSSYSYVTLGFEAEIEKFLGVSIDGAELVRFIPSPYGDPDRSRRILIESSWRAPSGRIYRSEGT